MELNDYLSLFPGASREKERLMALAEVVLRQVTDLAAPVTSIPAAFSFSAAEGLRLDALAESVGLSRESGMTDESFRQYLLQKLKLWSWDGTNEGVSDVLPAGVTETDNQDGSVTVDPAGTNPELLPVPAGIRMIHNSE